MEPINILILSCGTRNKIVQYFKNELKYKGKVIAADCSLLAPALYDADDYFIVPKVTDKNYINEVVKICKEYKIKGLISLIDPELNLISKNKKAFTSIGTVPIVSDFDVVEMCYNKYKFYEFLRNKGFKAIRSYIDIKKFYKDFNKKLISFPVFVKPLNGSASINTNLINSKKELEVLFNKYKNLMIQEYIDGIEYGVDLYIDMISNELVSIFAKQKILMKSGETNKAISCKNEELFELVENFAKSVGFRGVIDLDIFKKNDSFYISEVNPRFGGGYPHAYECGVNIPKMIINNLEGTTNENTVGLYNDDIYMMKFNDIKIISKT